MNAHSHSRAVISCEFFPPRTDAGMEKLLVTRSQLQSELDPAFFSVTFGAGGTTRDRTLDTIRALQESGCESVAPHISCMGSSRQQLGELVDTYRELGVSRLVTLRGDIPMDGNASGDFSHASELVGFIRERSGEHFHIEVAAYPEYHPECESPQKDFDYFVNKVRAGANSAITQYFYNIDAYLSFIERCERAALDIPVVPGIMPITNYSGLVRFSDNCGSEIPRWIRRQLEAYQDDSDSLRAFGVDVVSKLCNDLLSSGAPGLHFYTLNQAEATLNIWKQLDT